MRVRSASPFWPLKDGMPDGYTSLKQDAECDVAVVGAGLCGAIIARKLADCGARVVVVDKRTVGLGSTSASTALVLYEVDMHLSDLIRLRGERSAVRAYEACRQAVYKVERLARRMHTGRFRWKKSLYLASTKDDAARLKTEYETRRRFGFRVEYLGAADIKRRFALHSAAALLTREASEVDPYLLAYSLLREKRISTFERTEVVEFEPNERGATLSTDGGYRIRAKKVVFATGYETKAKEVRRVVRLKSSYAIATEPMPRLTLARDIPLIWETSRPYFYARTAPDNRVMMGGLDEDFVNPARRDRLIWAKARSLMRHATGMYPSLLGSEPAYAWAGTFGETEDSLPYIGEIEGFPNAYFALCYGANGTNFAVIASQIIRDAYLRRKNEDAKVFGFAGR